MSVTKSYSVIAALLLGFLLNGYEGAPNPCPQFLPVAVQLDQPYQKSGPFSLKTLVRVKNDNKPDASKPPESNLVVLPNDLEIPHVTSQQLDVLQLEPNKVTDSNKKHQLVAGNSENSKSPQVLELSTLKPEVRNSKPKKRRRNRPKESKRIILNQNSLWALRTINDKPAEEVLRTDKASVARDLKDSTESALVTVKQLDQQL